MSLDVVGIVGAGLVGTSIGLALRRAGVEVLLADVDEGRAGAAEALGAGNAVKLPDLRAATHVVVAAPPFAIGPVVREVQSLNSKATISDVASTKANVQREVETLAPHPDRFCGSHPVAGRERGGPGAAQPELFENAVWVIAPGPLTSPEARADATGLARRCGARVVELTPVEHDRALAVVSHVPQLVASAVAASLPAAGAHGPVLAGTGFRDTTRLADGDPDLWTEIVTGNAGSITEGLRALAGALDVVADALERGNGSAVRDLVARGRQARAALPGKASARGPAWARVGVVLVDRPGELARMLGVAAAAEVNVEDLFIDHSPDHPVGFVDVAVRPEAAASLIRALGTAGWHAHRTA